MSVDPATITPPEITRPAPPETSRSGPEDPPPASVVHIGGMLFSILFPLAGLAYAIWLAYQSGEFGWFEVVMLVGGTWLTGQGITLGYHRMLTHRAFDAKPLVRWPLVLLGALSLQKSPLDWCAAHRKHHAFSDRHGDPHSPKLSGDSFLGTLKGLWYAHMGWLFEGHIMVTDHQRYVPDLRKDRFLVWVHNVWHPLFVPLAFAIPALLGGLWYGSWDGALRGFLWGGCARIFLTHHFTWSVNSVCHLWGQRNFVSKDDSRNNLMCALVTSGEGWHNNHHAFPTSARLGLKWWQIDSGWMLLRLFKTLGLVSNVRVPSESDMLAKRLGSPAEA